MKDQHLILKIIFVLSVTVLILVVFLIYEQLKTPCLASEIGVIIETTLSNYEFDISK